MLKVFPAAYCQLLWDNDFLLTIRTETIWIFNYPDTPAATLQAGQISLRWPCPRPLSTFHLVLWPWLWLRAETDWCLIDSGGPGGGRGGGNTLTWLKDGFTSTDFNRVMTSHTETMTTSANRWTEGNKGKGSAMRLNTMEAEGICLWCW